MSISSDLVAMDGKIGMVGLHLVAFAVFMLK